MDDPRVLRIITVGLVLAVLAVAYFLLTGGFGARSKTAQTTQTTQTTQVKGVASSNPTASATQATSSPKPSPSGAQSAYDRIVDRNQAGVTTLPKTGFPAGLAVVFSASAIISGLSLRKFPK